MKKFLLLVSLFSLTIKADESQEVMPVKQVEKSSKEENIQKLVGMMFNNEQMTNLVQSMCKQTFRNIPSKDRHAIPAVEKMVERMTEKFSSKETIKECSDIYSKYFDDAEIEYILKFYESETGKKVLKTMPEIASECGQIGMKIVQEVMYEFMPQEDSACVIENK